MAETGRHTNTVSGKRRPQNVYVDGNTVRKVQEVPERREYRQPEHSVRKNKAKPELTTPEQQVRGNKPLSKAARRNRAKANNMNRNFAIFLAALGILIVFCSINYLKLKTECTSKRSQLATLESQLAELKEELFNLRFQHAINQLDNPGRIETVKRDIARVNTVLRANELKDAE